MSRRAYWSPAAPGAAADGPAGREPVAAPTAQSGAPRGQAKLPPSRAVSRPVGACVGTPGITSSSDILALRATGRDVGAVLARMATLHEELARAHLDLSGILQNELAARRERALMSSMGDQDEPTRLLSVRDVAQRLGLSERTVRRLRRRGDLPAGIEVAGIVRWRPEEIDAWIASGGRA